MKNAIDALTTEGQEITPRTGIRTWGQAGIGGLVVLGIALAAYALPVDPNPKYAPNSSGGIDVTFDTVAGQTYFIEASTDLEHWVTLNYWTLGTGTPVTWSLTTSEANTFWRVWATDVAPGNDGVLMSDFDGDGILTGAELAAGTNPVDNDTDRDGITNSDEQRLGMTITSPAVFENQAVKLTLLVAF